MRLLGTLDYNIGGGGFLNRNYVGVPDMNHIFGNQTVIANPYLYSFQMAPYYQFSNVARTYAEGHVEWHLNGWLSNKIPVFRSLNWYFVAASNVLYINKDNYYYEISGGIENIGFKMFRLGRVDLVAGYSSLKNKPMVGIRISLAGMLYAILGIHSPDTF